MRIKVTNMGKPTITLTASWREDRQPRAVSLTVATLDDTKAAVRSGMDTLYKEPQVAARLAQIRKRSAGSI